MHQIPFSDLYGHQSGSDVYFCAHVTQWFKIQRFRVERFRFGAWAKGQGYEAYRMRKSECGINQLRILEFGYRI